ncbi:MAG: hypothetical protein AAFV29_11510, partial [Myxococcota bacterium]
MLVCLGSIGYGSAVTTRAIIGTLTSVSALVAFACSSDGDTTPIDPTADAGTGPVWVTEAAVPTQAQLLSVWGRAADDLWAVGWDGTIIHYDGETWTQETTTATVPLTGVSGLPLPGNLGPEEPRPDPVVFAVGWNGTILQRNPDGTWVPATVSEPINENLFGLALGDDDVGLAVGDNGRIVAWDGMAWTPQPLEVPGEFSGDIIQPKGTLQRVWTQNGNRFYVTGSGGAAYRSEQGLTRFEAIDTRISDPLRGVWGTGNNNVYAVGLDGLILRFSGGQWRRVSNNGADALPAVFLFGVAGTGGNDITIVGWQGTVARFDGDSWVVEETDSTVDLRDVWVDTATDAAFAVGASGTVLQRDFSTDLPAMQ